MSTTPTGDPATLEALAQEYAIVRAFQTEVERKATELKNELDARLKAAHTQTGLSKPSVDVVLPGIRETGSITLPKNADAVSVVDHKAFAEFVETHYPSEVDWAPVVRPSFVTSYMKALKPGADFDSGQVVDLKLTEAGDGEVVVVPGVKAIKGEGFKAPSFTGQQAMVAPIIAALRDGRLVVPALDAAAEPAAEPIVVPPAETPLPTAAEIKKLPREVAVDLCQRFGLDPVGSLPTLRKRIAAHLTDSEVAA